jgi:hypothetical protein
MAGTRRRSEALVEGDDDVAFPPAHDDPSGVMADPRVTSSPRSTTNTTVAEQPPPAV